MRGKYFATLTILVVVAVGCATRFAFLERGQELMAQGKWDEAFTLFQAASIREPTNLEYKIWLERIRPRAAAVHFKAGQKFFEEGRYEEALVEFQLALSIEPSLQRAQLAITRIKNYQDAEFYYQKGLEALRDKDERKAVRFLKKALSLNPNHKGAIESLEQIKAREEENELTLKSKEPITLKFRDTSLKEVLSALTKLTGINFIYDEAYKDFKISITLEDVPFKKALDLIFLANPVFYKVVDPKTIIVVPKIPAKIRAYEDLKIRTFFLNNMEVKKAAALVRTMLRTETIYANEELNSLMVRAEPEKLALVEKTLEANDVPPSEVVFDVEIIELSREKRRELGLRLSQYAISAQLGKPPEVTPSPLILDVLPTLPSPTGITSANLLNFLTLENLAGNRFIFFTMPSATFRFLKSVTDARLLSNPTIRTSNGVKASIHVGERVPFITSTVTPGGVVSETISFIDVGIRFEVQPNIHLDDEVTTNVRLEVSSIGLPVVTATSRAFRVSTRNSSTTLRLREGETTVIGGLISDEERTTTIKVAGLGDILILGKLFTTQEKTRVNTEILLSITPHIARGIPIPELELTDFWSGREIEYSTRPLFEGPETTKPPSDGGTSPPIDGSAPPSPQLMLEGWASFGWGEDVLPEMEQVGTMPEIEASDGVDPLAAFFSQPNSWAPHDGEALALFLIPPGNDGKLKAAPAPYPFKWPASGGRVNKIALMLKKKGYPAQVVSRPARRGGFWHHIVINGFTTREEAERTAARIEPVVRGKVLVTFMRDE